MKIDLEKAKKEFLRYTENYDLTNENINRKQGHSIRVMNISKQIATELNLTEEQIQIATLIGLLHDIARFEQYTQYQTYNDNRSFDHGDYGVKILDKDMRKYIETDEYDKIIKIAIKNHNKFEIEDGLNEEELLFSKIIRDADKIDILYETIGMFWKGEEKAINNTEISPEVMEKFEQNKLLKREKNKVFVGMDQVMSVLAFIFDINYRPSFKIIKENDYINKIIDRFEFKDKEKVRNIALQYLQEKER